MQHVIRFHGADHTVDATEPAPGLRAYRLPDCHCADLCYNARLGHWSGRQIAAFERVDEAENAGRLIADVTDWTRPVEDLVADTRDIVPELIDRIEGDTRGVLIPAQKPTAAAIEVRG